MFKRGDRATGKCSRNSFQEGEDGSGVVADIIPTLVLAGSPNNEIISILLASDTKMWFDVSDVNLIARKARKEGNKEDGTSEVEIHGY